MIQLKIDNLKKVMEEKNLNQSQLAIKLGVSRACLSRHISGQRSYPSAKLISALREVFPEYEFEFFFTFSVANKAHNGTH